jgi:hypothetical protein
MRRKNRNSREKISSTSSLSGTTNPSYSRLAWDRTRASSVTSAVAVKKPVQYGCAQNRVEVIANICLLA